MLIEPKINDCLSIFFLVELYGKLEMRPVVSVPCSPINLKQQG